MNVLSADGIGRDLGERWLFRNLTFGILQGEKVALIGSNGSGKSSLLKIVSGETETDGGTVSLNQNVRMGFLEQDPEFLADQTVLETIFYAENEITTAIKNYEKAVEKGNQDLLAEAIETLDSLQAWDYEAKVKQILGRLGIQDFEKNVQQLSGGQKKRVALAKILIDQPDFLILDEPTNHLDLETIEWLEGYLSSSNITLLLVTHDRYFLDKVCNRILEIEDNQIFKYTGNYAYYLEKKAERREIEAATQEKNQNRLKKELEWMRRQPKARTTKAQYRIDAFHDLKERTKGFRREESVELNVRTERLGKKIIEIHDLSKKYGEKSLISHFSYTFKRGDKIGVVGKNGVGKTTFLDIIQNYTKPDSGRVVTGETVKIGYYSQSGLSFRDDQKIIDVVREIADYIKLGDGRELSISNFLTMFLFPPKKQHQYVEKLSGGEKRRLQLLKVLVESPNFLILDEPTNDLDIDTLNVLEEFLENYGGCVLVVTHDRYFMDKIVDHVFAFEGNGYIKDFPGNYTQYRLWKDEQEKEQVAEIKAKAADEYKSEKPQNEEKRKLSYKEKREFEALEKQIADFEERKAQIMEQMNGDETDFTVLQKLGEELESLKEELEMAELRWLELSEYAQ
ncbi:ABC-F family ATP-binding cassette domain-containing protein [Marinilongibacter aquaticus]|uniref:ABC-F family ATP-binding cassette domain-containing protein n=1 Tax=Marinilongibacter aquaticus TaxID=2975157 RepID=UPI0021BD2E83|nr:ABC-F family ATP-binding cassette domain-containing protein [Marinilongibacter aquaticus]UBM60352.1 ABC-F family ATP-binding cassette domain-containing protein [Marinilongibacter aquaticus]